jgi:hypothetical protein
MNDDTTGGTGRFDNPLGLIIGAVAAGFVAGALIPLTKPEKQRLQPIGSDIARRALEARDEVIEHGRGILGDTVSAAQEAVQKHGKELADSITTSVADVASAIGKPADTAPSAAPPSPPAPAASKPAAPSAAGAATPPPKPGTPSAPKAQT